MSGAPGRSHPETSSATVHSPTEPRLDSLIPSVPHNDDGVGILEGGVFVRSVSPQLDSGMRDVENNTGDDMDIVMEDYTRYETIEYDTDEDETDEDETDEDETDEDETDEDTENPERRQRMEPQEILGFVDCLPRIPIENIPEDEASCSICLESFASSQEVVVVLICGHKIGYDCILRWLNENHFTCPFCRADVYKGPRRVERNLQAPQEILTDLLMRRAVQRRQHEHIALHTRARLAPESVSQRQLDQSQQRLDLSQRRQEREQRLNQPRRAIRHVLGDTDLARHYQALEAHQRTSHQRVDRPQRPQRPQENGQENEQENEQLSVPQGRNGRHIRFVEGLARHFPEHHPNIHLRRLRSPLQPIAVSSPAPNIRRRTAWGIVARWRHRNRENR